MWKWIPRVGFFELKGYIVHDTCSVWTSTLALFWLFAVPKNPYIIDIGVISLSHPRAGEYPGCPCRFDGLEVWGSGSCDEAFADWGAEVGQTPKCRKIVLLPEYVTEGAFPDSSGVMFILQQRNSAKQEKESDSLWLQCVICRQLTCTRSPPFLHLSV